jgi:hypothetical protein
MSISVLICGAGVITPTGVCCVDRAELCKGSVPMSGTRATGVITVTQNTCAFWSPAHFPAFHWITRKAVNHKERSTFMNRQNSGCHLSTGYTFSISYHFKNGFITFCPPNELCTNKWKSLPWLTVWQGHSSTLTKGREWHLVYSPERKNNEAADEKYEGKDEKQGVTGFLPSSVRKHLSRLQIKEETSFR